MSTLISNQISNHQFFGVPHYSHLFLFKQSTRESYVNIERTQTTKKINCKTNKIKEEGQIRTLFIKVGENKKTKR